jgi:hypothetical protein
MNEDPKIDAGARTLYERVYLGAGYLKWEEIDAEVREHHRRHVRAILEAMGVELSSADQDFHESIRLLMAVGCSSPRPQIYLLPYAVLELAAAVRGSRL